MNIDEFRQRLVQQLQAEDRAARERFLAASQAPFESLKEKLRASLWPGREAGRDAVDRIARALQGPSMDEVFRRLFDPWRRP